MATFKIHLFKKLPNGKINTNRSECGRGAFTPNGAPNVMYKSNAFKAIYNEDENDYKKRKLVESESNSITLYELIRAVVYEMSFCGVGDSREDFKENLNSSYEEYKEDPSQAVSYSSTNLNDLLEDLKLQGQEEQAEKTIKKLEAIFNEIENEELLIKMKNLLFTSIKN